MYTSCIPLFSLNLLLQSWSVTARSIPRSRATDPILANGTSGPYTLPQNANNTAQRKAVIQTKQLGFLYGPPLAGGPYYPTGVLGLAKTAADTADIQLELTPEETNTATDSTLATAGLLQYDGLSTVNDYTKLYNNEWTHILPNGPDPGVLTNYTQDLLFSMERLSINPYSLRRLDPSSDTLAFQVGDEVANQVANQTLQQLFQAGRLFYVDYSDQKSLTPVLGTHSAAVDAYFYIDPTTRGDFLPLAIHSNVGSELVYTPADSAEDWLLAKIMYNVNDFWFAQWNHLAATHEVIQIAWMAAIRTLSCDHPVFALLQRMTYEVFSIQPLAETVLFFPGTSVDQVFAYTGQSAQDYSSDRYANQGAGRFQANYFLTDLENRGLVNSNIGPPLEHFPFYEDASQVHNAISTFMTSFVNSYYSSDADVLADNEIQAWVTEAQGPAEVIDFPSISSRSDLADAITHIAHLGSTAHHTINTNELISVSSTLPFHPPALYNSPPTSKGNPNVVSFLPPFVKVLEQFTVAGLFARPLLVATDRTAVHMFDDLTLLSRMNDQTQAAAQDFKATMQQISLQINSRTFDINGLSQGMPFIWQALDPNVMPYSVST